MVDAHVRWLRDQILERFLTAKAAEASGEPVTSIASHASASIAEHVAMNDPATVIRTCLAEIAIVARHTSAEVSAASGVTERRCRTCEARYPCDTIRILHDAYRERPGWTNW